MKTKIVSATLMGCFALCYMTTTANSANPGSNDKEEIIAHIHSIFKAFLNQDLKAIRALHTEDWTGFQNRSRNIIKGIDEYMKGPERSTANFPMQEYEIEDIEVQLYGDIAIVYYIAQWKSLQKSTGQLFKTRARSVDIYRKDEHGWNQAGSHLSILPSVGSMGNLDCAKCFDVNLVSEK